MAVDPDAHAKGGHQQSGEDGTTGDATESVHGRPAGEGHPNAARDGVGSQAGDGAAVLGVDGELHGSGRLVDLLIVDGEGGVAPPLSIFEGGQFGNRLIMIHLGKLRRPYAGGVTRRAGDTGERFVVVFTGDPYMGTVREAGCLSENHGSGRLVDGLILGGHRGIAAPCCASLEFGHHLNHLAVVDAGRIPFDAIGGLAEHPPNLALSHATNELIPGGLIIATEFNTCLSGVVEELIVADPQGGIPGFVVGPAVVGVLHGSGRLVDVFSLQGQAAGSGG